jgi:outer membrane protein assembly factor BamB
MLTAVDAGTGAVRWQVSLPQGTVPAVVGGPVTVGLPDGTQLTAYDATTGKAHWQRNDALSIWQAPNPLSALPASDPLLVSTYTGYAGLDPATGAVRWTGTWPNKEYDSLGGAYNPAPMDPASGDGRYYWFDGQTAFAMASATGAILWTTSAPEQAGGSRTGGATEYYAGGMLYGIEGNQITAFDGATGQLRWSAVTDAGQVTALHVAL